MNYSSNRKKTILLGQNNNALTWLIIANAVFFAAILFLKLIFIFAGYSTAEFQLQVLQVFALPPSIQNFISQPWSLFTFMFSEVSVWGLLINMLWLWAFGFILQDLSGNKTLIPIYLYGGFVAALVYLICFNVIPGFINNTGVPTPLMGAGPSVMAVAIATTFLAPQYRLLPMLNGGIPLWVLTLIFCFINIGIAGSGNGAYVISTIFSGLAGYVFIWQYNKGRDFGAWMFGLVSRIDGLFNPEKKLNRTPVKERHFYKATKKPFEKKTSREQKLDEILDKIHQKGYQNLSQDEKDFLAAFSKEENI